MATATQHLMTADEFGLRPDSERIEELVRGRIVMSPPPSREHGMVCNAVGRLFGNFVAEHGLGRVLNNDSGVITERDPDTVRGADVAYYSYGRLPKERSLRGYGPEIPELVFEVLSPSDRWSNLLVKVGEYLNAGVLAVALLDPETREAHVYRSEARPVTLGADDPLTFPDILPGFQVAVGRLFD